MSRRLSNLRYVVLLAMLLAYANSFQNGFHFDDFHTVTDNPAVRSLKNVPRFFTDTTSFSVLPANQTYRPVVSTSLAVDYTLGRGYAPVWFHLSTFLWFCLLVWLLMGWYAGMFAAATPTSQNRDGWHPAWLAIVAAAWFGLHPAMAETVNYVIQRGDLYCTLGCVAALTIYARAPRLRRWGLYLLPVALAMLSKPPAAVFPVLLLGYVWFFEAEGTSSRRWRVSAVAAVPSAAVVAAMLWLQAAMTPKTFLPSMLSPWAYRLVQPYVWLRYFGALFLPLHLNVDSDLGPLHDVWDPRALAGLAFVVVLLAAMVYAARRRRLYPIAYGLLWFVVTELPTSLYPLSEVENDHRMFFSLVGLIAAVVWAAWLAVERLPASLLRAAWLRPVAVTLVVLALGGYGYGVHARNRVWRDDESLWRDDVEKSPHNGRGLMNYGLTQMAKGAYPQALELFTRALAFTPNYATLEINLGIVNGAMADQGDASRSALAEQHFLRAITLAPHDDQTHAFYGRWLKNHRRMTEAIEQLKTAVRLNPQRLMQRDELAEALRMSAGTAQDAAGWINQSLAQYQQGQYAQAIASAERALALDPKSAAAWNNIAAGYASLHRWDDAIAAARKAIALKPDFQLAKNNLAWSMAQKQAGAK